MKKLFVNIYIILLKFVILYLSCCIMRISYVCLLLYYLSNNAAANEPHSTHFGQKDDVEDVEHMKKHLHGRVDTNSVDNPEMMRFYYFNMHDLNKDNRLDGLEIIKAVTHYHKDDHNVEVRVPSDDELEAIVDGIMESDDFNRDGFQIVQLAAVALDRINMPNLRWQKRPLFSNGILMLIFLLLLVTQTAISVRLAMTNVNNFAHGSVIIITGYFGEFIDRVVFNLLAGKDIVFHFNPRFTHNKVYRNSKINGTWGKEEFDSEFPFAKGSNFSLFIVCQRTGYRVFVDYKAKFFYEHRFLVPRVDKVTVDGDKNMTKLYDLLRKHFYFQHLCKTTVKIHFATEIKL
ncbi:Multiple coagulation factor deficiency protein 2 -like protein [Trichinella zimbabwensis]|uniref:Galectin n=1 Tax=Trichinella zimbabwensis TaxID=268475 RepID=A0A0V1HH07_9BILA|nr:Multiple coagulation factor deficiency protein 2 -like protein [Trichinella zimbabwensis]